MLVTATQIADWAKTKNAQAALPRLVRRLIHVSANLTQAAFPAGDSSGLPGWDGELRSVDGNPWIPRGKSFWEFSCDTSVTTKANKDYNKRTRQTPKMARTKATFVIVSARRWSRKGEWLKKKRRTKQWAEVRAYDADDIEQWLEQSTAVALQFAEELGLRGPGVESIAKHWGDWAQQSYPPINSEALFIDRQDTRDRFLADLQGKLESGQPGTLTVRADSVDEAAAFVCASLLTHPQLSAKSLVVTQPIGWGYVEQNPTLKVCVAARPEFAEKPTRRNGFVVVIPHATGDMAGYRGAAGRGNNTDLTIERPKIYEFEKALISIGLDEADSKRFAVSTGRSWSVFRRRSATNPAIRKPAWRDVPQARVLSTLCLLGGWSAEKAVDREIVTELSGLPYEEVDRDLRRLVKLDDAPVLLIGEVWKARSPLELLDLYGDQITRDELDRFFKIAKLIFTTPDPQLEPPDEERHAAQIYGKVRSQSELLIEALCDTLIKLAVRGPQVSVLASANIEERVAALVHDLLYDADGTRWLSLSSFLPDLAEAAPEAFMGAIEASLSKPDAPITRLITETSNSGILGRCWHSGLLWALERLAWAPEHLARVSLILARLSHVKIKGNWANTPLASLADIYRSWFPQTAADITQRIAALDTLIAKEPDAAFDLLDKLVHVGFDHATPTARPIWRDDDAVAGYGATPAERHRMLVAAADRLIACSKNYPTRIVRLIGKITIFDQDRINVALGFANQFTKPGVADEDRETIRAALRKHIHRHRNYDKARGKALDKKLKAIEDIHKRLVPIDLVIRHRWLFTDGWPELPALVRDGSYGKRGELVESWRINALRELYSKRGMSGIDQFIAACAPHSYYVGHALPTLNIDRAKLAEWITARDGEFLTSEPFAMAISGLLRALELPRFTELVAAVLEKAKKEGWSTERMARFLVLAPEQRTTWDIAATCGTQVENAYWVMTAPSSRLRSDGADFEFGLRRLLAAGRPRSALQVCHYDIKEVEPKLLAEMLERFLKGEEPDGPLPDSWSLGETIDALEASGSIENDRLVRLEFGLVPALGYEGEHHARSLYNAILSDPKLFAELLCILYKPANGERENTPSESEEAAAQIAWRVLHHCKRLPGAQRDGTVEREKLVAFVDEARRLCGEADRLAVCDITLGEILAHSPTGTDGVWPFEPVRDVLDRPELEKMRRGFHTGTMNKRGVTSRSPDEGGGQERSLVEEYRKHAHALQHSHVNLAAAIQEIARSYERYGRREDLEAQLRREGH